jgi:BirA family biotin operon repressor/biotin-[acetyl-CoA-carboxylase] ligase
MSEMDHQDTGPPPICNPEYSPIFDVPRVESETFVRHVEYRRSTASTNDLAIELMRETLKGVPLLVLAEQQRLGRGRGSNRWWSAAGALTFTLVVDTNRAVPPTGNVPSVSLVVALAICEALDRLDLAERFHLKWPNDVLAGRRKVAGILTEVPAQPGDLLVIGIGINVNNSPAHAPSELQQQATSLADLANRQFDVTEILVRVLQQLSRRLADFAAGHLHLGQACASWSALRGRTVRLKTGRRRVCGVCEGIDDDGALLIRGDGIHRLRTGTVEHVEWEE